MTFALSGSMVTFSVLATALFGAILTVRALGTSFLAVFADPAALARAMPVERIARGIVLTRAFVLAFATPQTHRTANITVGSSISCFALTGFRCYATAVQTLGGTNRYTAVFGRVFCVSLATLFHWSRFDQILILVNGFELDLVLGASRGHVQTPDEFTHLVRLLLGHSHFYRIRFLSYTNVWSFKGS